MYDPTTAALIRSSPELPNLDHERLPEFLAATYAQLISERLNLRTEGVLVNIDTIRRIANTYQSYAVLFPDRENRRAAAFVSATAHHLLSLSTHTETSEKATTRLARDYITSDIAALLLFLASGYPADAAQMSRHMRPANDQSPASSLLRTIRALGEGQLERIQQEHYVSSDISGFTEAALDELWKKLFEAAQVLARTILGDEQGNSIALCREVQKLAVEHIDDVSMNALSVFAGPHQLASLLAQAGENLLTRRLTSIPPPNSVPVEAWTDFLRHIAKHRPYLWENHLEAISTGYLDIGTSAVLSFPTGAGKSTLAELKIAATILTDRQVIFIVPTHALVGQVRSDLKKAFPQKNVKESLVLDGAYSEIEESSLPDIAVMTPERTLALLATIPDAFANVGLVVLDECHLLHPSGGITDRRSLDAMLCFLRATELIPDADVLMMSAMMGNEKTIAQWVEELTARRCIPLRLDWKPTRQARGCVVFESSEVESLRSYLQSERGKVKPKPGQKRPPAPSTKVQKNLQAVPAGLFCLKQLWSTKDTEDYTLVPLLEQPVALSANAYWQLIPNRNHVAAMLAIQFGKRRMKTLVFAQNKRHAVSLAKEISASCPKTIDLSESQKNWREDAIEELGEEAYLLGLTGGQAAVHHGLLLSPERYLVEDVYRNNPDLSILVGTPTLAQGMNLPAQVVIIAGDDRFDAAASRNEQLRAHELLNAVGRAGRAGHAAEGVVLLVPGKVITIDQAHHKIANKWMELQENIFSKADQCLDIEDPIDAILDYIHDSSRIASIQEVASVDYFVSRLPSDTDSARHLLNRSLAAFHARSKQRLDQFNLRVDDALKIRSARKAEAEDSPDTDQWKEELATATGLHSWLISEMVDAISDLDTTSITLPSYIDWFFAWLQAKPQRAASLFRNSTFESTLSSWCDESNTPNVEGLGLVRTLVHAWMNGEPLSALQYSIEPEGHLGKCEKARSFVLQCVPEVSYAIGIFALICRNRAKTQLEETCPLVIAVAAACIKDGADAPEKLALRHVRGLTTRQKVLREFSDLADYIPQGELDEKFWQTCYRVRLGLRKREDEIPF
jgi:superfamily II DNA/RNA helicase